MKKLSPLLFLFIIFLSPLCSEEQKGRRRYDYQLAVTAIFQDEAPYLKEWIEYYKLIGVEHFYLYNNLSQDDYLTILKPYIDKGEVDLVEWPHDAQGEADFNRMQVAVYEDALSKAKYKSKWLAIFDIDEFAVPVKENLLPRILKRYESQGGVCLIWSFFGTSHVDRIPENKLMIETLVYHSGPANGGLLSHIWNNGAYKSIVRPEYVKSVISPHYCSYVKGKGHGMLNYSLAHINHYWTRDEYFLNHVKIPRRGEWAQSPDSVRNWAAGMNGTQEGNPIIRFIPQLRTRMGMKTLAQ